MPREKRVKVSQLVELLKAADPNAEVLVFPPHADPTDGAPLAEVLVPDDYWTHETGLCNGSDYEIFYPGAPEAIAPPYSNVDRRKLKVVLVGEELGNFRGRSG